MTFDAEIRRAIVARANLAPSVHNTQPARWRFEADGTIIVLADQTRFLKVGDPLGRDAALSCGAAIEGTIIALSKHGLFADAESCWQAEPAKQRLKPVARIVPRQGGEPSHLLGAVDARFTWRGKFVSSDDARRRELGQWASRRQDVVLATNRNDLEMLATLNDETSLCFYRRNDYRNELLNWMRLARSHPRYDTDGLNLEALQLSPLEGHTARIALGSPSLFRLLDLVRIAGPMLAERSKTLSATAVVLFHRPCDEPALDTGRIFYRMWLELTLMGYAAWPMAVLADDAQSAITCCSRFGIDDDRRLINLLRVGGVRQSVLRARRRVQDLIVDEEGTITESYSPELPKR